MTCCGKTKKLINIGKGYVNYTLDRLFDLPKEKKELAERKIKRCQLCPYHTWLKKSEYLKYLKELGIEVIKNFDQLEKLPPLPKKKNHLGTRLFCTICKCWIPAKAYSEDETCPKDLWSEL